jgi:hypothetical protein
MNSDNQNKNTKKKKKKLHNSNESKPLIKYQGPKEKTE